MKLNNENTPISLLIYVNLKKLNFTVCCHNNGLMGYERFFQVPESAYSIVSKDRFILTQITFDIRRSNQCIFQFHNVCWGISPSLPSLLN